MVRETRTTAAEKIKQKSSAKPPQSTTKPPAQKTKQPAIDSTKKKAQIQATEKPLKAF